MDNAVKICLLIGAALIILGLVIFTVVMTINHWDFSKLSTVKYVTNTHRIDQDFSDISVQTDTADIRFVLSDSEVCEVVCHEAESEPHSVSVQDGCLTIHISDHRKWYEYIGIGFNFGRTKLTVTLPRSVYGKIFIKGSTGNIELPKDFSFENIEMKSSTGNMTCLASASESMKIHVSTGDIRVEQLSAGSMDLKVTTGHVTATDIHCQGSVTIGVSTGKAYLTNVTCGSLTSTGTTGNLTAKNVMAAETLSIKRNTGDVTLDKCDAAELFIQTTTGNITGSLLSEKVFITQASTGKIHVPKTTTGGKCEISTTSGNIQINIAP